MKHKVDNAIIMAAGYASRFAPISYECPKALLEVKGEILIERQINQLREVGIEEIVVVVGYKKEEFYYLKDKYGVIILENEEYNTKNNHASIYAAKNYLKNTYICSSDNYFTENPFESEVDAPYYAAVYADGCTKEWCIKVDDEDWIVDVTVGGKNAWYMLGHAFWSKEFSKEFISCLELVYRLSETKNKFWEDIYIDNIDELKLKIRRYDDNIIFEFDSLDELRAFDEKYINNTGSLILKQISSVLNCEEKDIKAIEPIKDISGNVNGFIFKNDNKEYRYLYETCCLLEVKSNAERN